MKKYFVLIILILVICGCSNSTISSNGVSFMEIDTKTVFNEIDNKNTYIIDVREDYEYAGGHIRNAYNIPLTSIEDISKLMILSDSKIIVYCHSGNRSRKAAIKLVEMGYSNVYDMGGIDNWNYDLIKG